MKFDQNPLKSRTDQLLQLAARLDRTSQTLRTKVSIDGSDVELTDTEEQELQRIQGALDFIHQVCPPDSSSAEPHTCQRATPTRSEFSTPALSVSHPRTDKEPPSQVGRFEIIRLLGQGGFAKVFLAHDPHLNRNVALKLLRSSLFFSEDVINRFEREARAAAVLNHPNIVPVFESGTIDGQPFIASAFCDGETLEQWIDSKETVAHETAASMVANMADALEHAHQRGIIHRDLKPANVLIITGGTDFNSGSMANQHLPGELRITDFGLAKDLGRVDQLETAEGAIVGTPAYMSPEQAAGKQKLDPASDIYSLGVVLYELLTGRLPILGETNIDTLLAIKTEEPPSPRSIRKEIPRDLEAICLKCLSKSASHRYRSAHELATDLRHWSMGEPIAARTTTSLERLGKWIRRNPLLASAFAALSITTAIAIFQWSNASFEYGRAESNLKLANEEADRAQRHLALSQNVIDNMVVQVADDAKLPPALRRSVAEKASRFQDQLLEDAPEDPKVALKAVRAHNRLGQMLYDMSELEAGLKSANAAIEIGSRFPDNQSVAEVTAFSKQLKAGILVTLDRADESQKIIKEAQDAVPNLTLRAGNHFSLGMANMQEGKLDEALAEFNRSIELVKDVQGNYINFPRARAHFFAGRTELMSNRMAEAMERTEKALALFEAISSVGHGGNVIQEEFGRCEIQLAEIRIKMLDADPDSDEVQAIANSGLKGLDKGAEIFQDVYNNRPNVDRYIAQKAYCIELKCQIAARTQDTEGFIDYLNDFDELLDSTEAKNRLRSDMRESYLASRQRLIQFFRDQGKLDRALEQSKILREESQRFLDDSGEERFAKVIEKGEKLAEELLTEMDE